MAQTVSDLVIDAASMSRMYLCKPTYCRGWAHVYHHGRFAYDGCKTPRAHSPVKVTLLPQPVPSGTCTLGYAVCCCQLGSHAANGLFQLLPGQKAEEMYVPYPGYPLSRL